MAPNSLCQDLKHLFSSKHDSDCTFVIHGKELPAHKLIVAARSPFLKRMVEGPMAPADQRHPIDDPAITFEDFENLIKFLYTDECEIEQSNFKVVLHLANYYDVAHLQTICVDQLYRFLNNNNAFDFAEMTISYSFSSLLLPKCFQKIDMHFNSSKTLSYRIEDDEIWISPDVVTELVKYCKRGDQYTDNEIFAKVFQWSEKYCIQQNLEITPESINGILAPIMQHFEPQKLCPLTLVTDVKENNLLPDDQLFECLVESVKAGGHRHRSRNRDSNKEYYRNHHGYNEFGPRIHGRRKGNGGAAATASRGGYGRVEVGAGRDGPGAGAANAYNHGGGYISPSPPRDMNMD